jgi:hypothetical protein
MGVNLVVFIMGIHPLITLRAHDELSGRHEETLGPATKETTTVETRERRQKEADERMCRRCRKQSI